MRARAIALSVALLLLAGTTAGVASADQGRQASAPTGLNTLLPPDQVAPTGPAQWYMPWFEGNAGSNYLGVGGWRSYQPYYGMWGPYPTPQTAAFFGATNSPLDPWSTYVLTNQLAFQNALSGQNTLGGQSSLTGFGPLATASQTGLAPLANMSLATAQQLGIGTSLVNGVGTIQFAFGVPGSAFTLPTGQGLNAATLGQLVGAVPVLGFGPLNNAINGIGGTTGLSGFGTIPFANGGTTALPGFVPGFGTVTGQ